MDGLNKSSDPGTSSDLREVKGYVWVYWCLARRATGRREDDDASLVVQAVLQKIEGSEPEATKAAYGYSASRRSLWLRPNRIDESKLNTGATNPSLAFYESRPSGRDVQAALAEFVGSREFELWRAGKLQTSSRLSQAQREALQKIAGQHCRLDWAYEGVLLLGQAVDAGIVWFGIRSDERLATLPATDQGARLRRPIEFVRVADVQAAHKLPGDALLSERAARELAAVVLHHDVETADGIPSDSTVWFFRTPQELVAVSTLPALDAETEVLRRTQHVGFDTRLLLLGREQVDAALSQWPWLWRGRAAGDAFSVLRASDEDALQELLLGERRSGIALNAVEHPSVRSYDDSPDVTVVIGQPGSGKSTALAQLAARRGPDAYIILVHRTLTQQDVLVIETLIQNFADTPFAIVTDDVETYLNDTLMVTTLVRFASLASRERRVMLLLSYNGAAAVAVSRTVWSRLAKVKVAYIDVTEWSVDDLGLLASALLPRVPRLALAEPLEEVEVEVLGARYQLMPGTTEFIADEEHIVGSVAYHSRVPRRLVEWMRRLPSVPMSRRELDELTPRDDSQGYWAEVYSVLLADEAVRADILRVVACFRQDVIPDRLICACASGMLGYAVARCDDALRLLQLMGWLRREGSLTYSKPIIKIVKRDLEAAAASPASFLASFFRWIARAENISDNDRAWMLGPILGVRALAQFFDFGVYANLIPEELLQRLASPDGMIRYTQPPELGPAGTFFVNSGMQQDDPEPTE